MLDEIVGGPGTTPAPAPAPAPAAWHASFAADPDTAAYIAAKGLDKLPDLGAAFAQVAAFHRQAEGYIGVPESERVRLPNPADPASVKAFWSKVGVGETPAAYDFSAAKGLDPALATAIQNVAHEANVPVAAAQRIAAALADHNEKSTAAELTQTQERLTAQRAELQRQWGPNYNANLQLADQAARRLGVDVDTAALLGEKIGTDKVLEMFRKIGAATAEDTFVLSPNKEGAQPPTTIADANYQLEALHGDSEWVKRFLAGGHAEQAQHAKLFQAAHPDLYAAAAA